MHILKHGIMGQQIARVMRTKPVIHNKISSNIPKKMKKSHLENIHAYNEAWYIRAANSSSNPKQKAVIHNEI